MAVITRNRTIRPSTRLEKSKSYKIDTKNVSRRDILVVNIDHEIKPFRKTFKFNSSDVEKLDSISFSVIETETSFEIIWSRVKPIATLSPKAKTKSKKSRELKSTETGKIISDPITHIKTSFAPISNADIEILILGSREFIIKRL